MLLLKNNKISASCALQSRLPRPCLQIRALSRKSFVSAEVDSARSRRHFAPGVVRPPPDRRPGRGRAHQQPEGVAGVSLRGSDDSEDTRERTVRPVRLFLPPGRLDSLVESVHNLDDVESLRSFLLMQHFCFSPIHSPTQVTSCARWRFNLKKICFCPMLKFSECSTRCSINFYFKFHHLVSQFLLRIYL